MSHLRVFESVHRDRCKLLCLFDADKYVLDTLSGFYNTGFMFDDVN